MLNNIFLERRVIFSSIEFCFAWEPERLSIKHIFFHLILVFPVFMKARELASDLYNIIFLETSPIGVCTLWKQLWSKTWSCHEQKSLPVPVSYCLSLCFVPPQSQSASPKQRKQSVFTPPALKGTVQVLSLPWQGTLPLRRGFVSSLAEEALGREQWPSAHEQHSCETFMLSHRCFHTLKWLSGIDHLPDNTDHLFILTTESCSSGNFFFFQTYSFAKPQYIYSFAITDNSIPNIEKNS